MSDFVDRYSRLSPAKRALLTQRLLNKNSGEASRHATIPRRTGSETLPLSFAQERLWLLEQLEPGTNAYNLPLAARISGALDQAAFARSLQEIQRRHEVLRTTFKQSQGKPEQIICARCDLEFEIVDLAARPVAEREAEVLRRAKAEAVHAFDLGHGPLLRCKLLRVSHEEHVLLLVMHHVVADGWSVALFSRELATLYNAFVQRRVSPLPELPIQYADYAVWQRQWLQGERFATQVEYWKRKLAGAPPLLELPTDRPRPAAPSYRGDFETFRLPANFSQPLLALLRQENVTLFMFLLAAFKVLLARYSGQTDLVLGTPVANRNRPELEKLIGFFVNTLVLRTSLEGNPSFLELLRRVRETTLEAYGHQDLPFEKLVEVLQPERNLSYAPIFQVMFALQPPSPPVAFEGITITPMPVHGGTAKFDLLLTMLDLPEGLAGAFEYSTDLFEAATIKRMAGHFQELLQSFVANPEQRIAEVPILTRPERAQLFTAWNDTARVFPEEKCFQQLFAEQAARTPEAVAVVCEERHLTYRELNHRANQLAHHLRRKGLGPESLVGLCVERTPEMMIGLLGIMKSGAAYVPLDPAYPQDRLAYVLDDARVPLLLTTQSTIDNYQLAIGNCELLRLDSDWRDVAKQPASNPNIAPAPENLAYVIYTSGSTGKPKGVGIPHRALTNFLWSMKERPGLSTQDIMLAVTTLSFDIAGLELYLPLMQGACVVLARHEIASDARSLSKLLATSCATIMQATPATWRMLLEVGWSGASSLKILCGGEALPPDLARALLERCAALWNMYGPTETTIWSAIRKLETGDELIDIGKPIANTQAFIVDRRQHAVPLGVHGELLLGGAGLARGYLNRPDLTAEKFVPNGLMPNDRMTRLYKTGDRARHLPQGSIDCLGRLDHQIKLRGFRIELGEIEAVCMQHPEVAQAAVVLREDEPGDKRLVAYLVARLQSSVPSDQPSVTGNQQLATGNQLRTFLSKQLPEYMIPSAFIFMEALPLTPNGKVDRKALPAPQKDVNAQAGVREKPSSPVEELLAEIWLEVLGLTRVGVHDNFFELGGHSLLAVRLFVEIERSFQRSLPLASIFKAPTIKQLAALIRDAEALPSTGGLVTLQEEGDEPPLFCVSGYEGHTFIFRQLARHLGNTQPVYGLHYPGLEGECKPLTRVEDIAEEFVRQVQNVQPNGPYRLSGMCFGGLVVYEMAQQLTAQGHAVEALVLFDTFAPGGVRALEQPQNLKVYDEELEELVALQAEQTTRTITPNSLEAWIAAVRESNILAHQDYRPRPYAGRVILFRPTKRPESWQHLVLDPLNGWGELARGGIEVYAISGYHEKMFREPKVQKVAKRIRNLVLRNVARDLAPQIREAELFL